MFTGCGRTVYQIEPEDEFEYYEGRKIITLESDSLFLSLNFENYSRRESQFFIFAENLGSNKFMISPENITMTVLAAEDPRYSEKTYSAADPERTLQNLKKSESALETQHETESTMNCLFATFGVVSSIADDDDDTDPLEESGIWLREMEEEENEYKYNKENIRMERAFWKNEVFRISELGRNDAAGGLIVFPFIKSATRLVISVKTENLIFDFYFAQKKKET
jgi:hypothetical protein